MGRGRREERKKQKDQGRLFIEKASPKEMAEEVKNKKMYDARKVRQRRTCIQCGLNHLGIEKGVKCQ